MASCLACRVGSVNPASQADGHQETAARADPGKTWCPFTPGIADPFEQALAYFLFASLQQFYFDGKPTRRRRHRCRQAGQIGCAPDQPGANPKPWARRARRRCDRWDGELYVAGDLVTPMAIRWQPRCG